MLNMNFFLKETTYQQRQDREEVRRSEIGHPEVLDCSFPVIFGVPGLGGKFPRGSVSYKFKTGHVSK